MAIIPELPSHADYYEATHSIDEMAKADGGIKKYVGNYITFGAERFPAMRKALFIANNLGLLMEPIDENGEHTDPELAVTSTFVDGAAIGLMIAKDVHRDAMPMESVFSNGIMISQSDDENSRRSRHILAEELAEAGQKGLEVIGSEAREIVEHWEDAVVPDVTKQRFFRSACGLILLDSHNAHELASLSNGFDWDAAFNNL